MIKIAHCRIRKKTTKTKIKLSGRTSHFGSILFSVGENSNRNHETRKLFDIMYIWFLYNIYRLDALRIACAFVEELLYELMNVFIYYKTLTIHLDNIAAIIF